MAKTNKSRDAATVDGVALLIIDMINPLDFEGGKAMQAQAIAAARRIASLKRRFKEAGAPAIYVNDNFMQWQVDFSSLVAICQHGHSLGAPLAHCLPPEPDDYFVLKPKHSGFFDTPLSILLAKLGVSKLVVTGLAADGCVLTTATDAHMREYRVHVPRDCVASISPVRTDRALALMKDSMKIDVRMSRYVRV